MARDRGRKSKSRRRHRSREPVEGGYAFIKVKKLLSFRWEITPQYDNPQHHIPSQYYGDYYPMDGYMAPLPLPPSSASYPALVPSHTRTRSPSRICQYDTADVLRDAPPVASSQSYPENYNVSFADAFMMGGLQDNLSESPVPFMETTPQFGFPQQSPLGVPVPVADVQHETEYTIPTVVRKKPSGFFQVLERFSISPIDFNYSDLVASVVNDPAQLSTMWSGILSGSKLDRNFTIMLFIMEKVFMRFLEETVRRLRDDLQAQQLAVFLRQIWTALLPVCSETVEKWIVNYHEENSASFFKEVDTDEWDEEDESREKILDDLDQELQELQAEIDIWEGMQRHYPGACDERAARFIDNKLFFVQRLNLLASIPTESTSKYQDGGFMEKPELPAWEHPIRRKKLQIRDMMCASVISELGTEGMFTNDDNAMGIPASGFCFEPGVLGDHRWDSWNSPGWIVDVGDLPSENVAPPEALEPAPKRHHRPSLDALSAFN
jgi:hypothetical protein